MKEEYTNQHRRWYDKDPVLSQAVRTLEETDDETQIKIALNLIKIIIEHNIEDEKFEAVEDIINAVGSGLDDNKKGRWQRVIFPGGGPPSIVTEVSLYDRVRDGNGCFPHSWSPASLFSVVSNRRWYLLYPESCIRIIRLRNHF